MDVNLYTGNGTSQTITNSGSMSPDFVWIKIRSGAGDHYLADTLRGVSTALYTNNTDAERTEAGRGITAFNSNGFSLGLDPALRGSTNLNGATYVAWQWDAGTTTVTNTAGSISAQVRANPTAGFSVVTYTGTGSVSTIGHGLGVAPSMIIVKRRSATENWAGYHASLGATKAIFLNLTLAALTDSIWDNTTPTSTVFTTSGGVIVNGSGSTYVAYCWAAVPGYSAFGSYTGNGSTDGTFVYTGFRPEFVMVKRSDATDVWLILDAARDTYNVVGNLLQPQSSDADQFVAIFDFLSNGFKLRASGNPNNSGGTFIYMAFAENPFKNALAR
jgi:hypothetical protein